MDKIKIGQQVWMKNNLNVNHFRNGDLIPEASSDMEWEDAGKNQQAAWCYYENKSGNGDRYGRLYNWYAVNDPRGLAPEGWHIPSDEEWNQLEEYLGGRNIAGEKMKNKNDWVNCNSGNNESGFTGLPGGDRDSQGGFALMGLYGGWWSASKNDSAEKAFRGLDHLSSELMIINYDTGFGFSVRCIKD